ncbi:MAG TPA: hypothetical protein VFT39_00890 [Vicinamibacterales bacterium]|nr:hypothetical protein [Vicinamibacterales bacterium]
MKARAVFVALLVTSVLVSPRAVQAQMPDARQMSGVPLPVADLPPGTVTVRVVRGAMTNVVPGQLVELTGGPSTVSAKTNDAGRAEFSGLQPGTRVRASTTVNGERLESQEFAVPAAGGIRVALVATDAQLQQQADRQRQQAESAAQAGSVVLSDRSRFVFELGDAALNSFALLEIVNAAQGPVKTVNPIVFDLPSSAVGAGLLEGSTNQASVTGSRIIVNGPFAPGSTVVQYGYSLPISGGSMTVEQTMPLPLGQVSVLVQKMGDMQLESPQVAEHRDMPLQGSTFIVGKGPAVPAGQVIRFSFRGLPHAPVWPRNVALVLAGVILAAGAWASRRRTPAHHAEQDRRKRLDAKRDRLFAELTSIEEQHRDNTIDPERYATRRRELLASLERVYAQLDDEAA